MNNSAPLPRSGPLVRGRLYLYQRPDLAFSVKLARIKYARF